MFRARPARHHDHHAVSLQSTDAAPDGANLLTSILADARPVCCTVDMHRSPASTGRIFRFWAPLASTWLMMSVEGPFLAAIIARLDDPRHNLAAYGVAFAVAIIVEAPVIMMLSASTALVDGRVAFLRVRNFTYALNGALTAFMVLMLATPLWLYVAQRLIGLPDTVASLTQGALLLMLPWPGAIGYRRFYQGLLIRHGRPRQVAYGTAIRVVAMSAASFFLYRFSHWPGAWVGAGALSFGVCVEALAIRAMVRQVVAGLLSRESSPDESGEELSYRRIVHFYYPLALTSTISMAAHPVVTFFMGRAPHPLESLAVLPVVNAFVFIFRSLGLAYQEVCIALLAETEDNRPAVVRFALGLALATTICLALIALSPLARIWFTTVSGLDPELADFALLPLRVLVLMPALSVLLSLQRSFLVHARRTGPITVATLIEMGAIITVLLVATGRLQLAGAVAATIAFMCGRVGSNLFLLSPAMHAGRPRSR